MLALARLQIPASRIKIVSVQSKDLGRRERVRNLDPQDTVLLSFGAAHYVICWGYSESFEAFCWFDQMISLKLLVSHDCIEASILILVV